MDRWLRSSFSFQVATAMLVITALYASVSPVRQFVRRLRTSAPDRRILVGVWGEDPPRLAELRAAMVSDSDVELVTSLGEMVQSLGSVRGASAG